MPNIDALAGVTHFIPHPHLQDFVLGLTAIDVSLPLESQNAVTPYPPTPLQSIIFYFGNPIRMQRSEAAAFCEQPPIVIIGPQYTRVNIMVTTRLRAIRVDFRPSGLYRLLGIPVSELFDQGIPGEVFWGNAATELNERLLGAATVNDCIHHIQAFLIAEIRTPMKVTPFEHAIHALLKSHGSLSVEKVADLACVSVRQFERLCLQQIGMSPKSFARIARFSRAYRLRESRADLSWSSIAYESGYFDQMHLIRDFRQFAGTTPSIVDKDLEHTPLRMQATIL